MMLKSFTPFESSSRFMLLPSATVFGPTGALVASTNTMLASAAEPTASAAPLRAVADPACRLDTERETAARDARIGFESALGRST